MFKLNQIIAFQMVCNMGNNVSRAAKALGLTQPAVTTSIRELEKELGVQLFVHGDNFLMLTEAGSLVLSKADMILKDITDLQQSAASYRILKNTVRIGFSTSTSGFLTDLIKGYRAIKPSVEIQICERSVLEIDEMLNCGLLDVAILPDDQENTVHDRHSVPLFKDYFSFICRSDHPLADRTSIYPKDFADLDFVFYRRRNAKNGPILNMFTRNHIQPKSTIWVDNVHTVQDLILSSNACSLLFSSSIRRNQNLRAIPLADSAPREFHLFASADSKNNPEIQQFSEYITEYFSAELKNVT